MSIEPWEFCTHKHGDETLAQAGPCPLHDAIGYCQICGAFIFHVEDMEKHKGQGHYIQRIIRPYNMQCAKMEPCESKGETDSEGVTPCLRPYPCEYKLID